MASSLQEQLKNAGLATEKQLEEAERRQSRPPPRPQSKARPQDDKPRGKGRGKPKRGAGKKGAARAAGAPESKPPEKRPVPKDKRRLRQRVRALLEERALTAPEGEVPYNFVRGKRVKRLYVDEPLRARLLAGELVVAEVYGLHHVIDQKTLAELIVLLPETFVHRHGDEPAPAPDGEGEGDYSGYEVPDDLVW